MAGNIDRGMLPLQHLLNPSTSPPTTPMVHPRKSAVDLSYPGAGLVCPPASTTTPKHADSDANKRRTDDSIILAKPKPRGPVNYPPFEDIDDDAVQHLAKFKVTPFGRIHQEFHHIPYSSSKKDLFDKTGRESIEAFRYEFQVPGRDTTFIVMWDYNIGIVRMNPFIKWGQFPKTKSSQLLDKNPGLRDISPGITGGSVLAQGYWIPYRCARALFATFCYPIAGALIPLFGPTFPCDCIPPESTDYGNAAISPSLIREVAYEVGLSKHYYMEQARTFRSDIGLSSVGHDERLYSSRPDEALPQLRMKSGWEHPSSVEDAHALSYNHSSYIRERPCKPHDTPSRANHGQTVDHRRVEPYSLRGIRAQQSEDQHGQVLFPVAWDYKRRRLDPRLLCIDNEASEPQNQAEDSQRVSAQYSAAMALLLLSGDTRHPTSSATTGPNPSSSANSTQQATVRGKD